MPTEILSPDTRLVDLSIGLTDGSPSEPFPPTIDYYNHREGAAKLAEHFAERGYGDIEADDFPGGIGFGREEVHLTTHSGTHVDAPWHYGPMAGDIEARTIDEIPLEEFTGQADVLDFTWKKSRAEISKQEVVEQFDAIGRPPGVSPITLLETGRDALWGDPSYLTDFPGLGAEATRYLLESGTRVIGTDAYGIDKPFVEMARRYRETGDPDELWPAHFVGRELEYFQIEKMANLGALPRRVDVPIVAFPVNITGASGGWARPVAIIEDS